VYFDKGFPLMDLFLPIFLFVRVFLPRLPPARSGRLPESTTLPFLYDLQLPWLILTPYFSTECLVIRSLLLLPLNQPVFSPRERV